MAYPANMTVGQIRELVENPGQPIRQPAVSLFTIDSADRYTRNASGTTVDAPALNNLYINKQQSLINGYITRIALTEINMPWDIPNVNDRNNTLGIALKNFPTAGTDTPIVIALQEGFYTPADLASTIETELSAAVLAAGASTEYSFDVTYTASTRSFTIENTSAGLWYLAPTPAGDDDLTNMMGFGFVSLKDPAIFADGYEVLQGAFASMLYTPYFDIVSRQLTKKQNINDNSTSIVTGNSLLARIYINPYGFNKLADGEVPLGCAPFTLHQEFQNPKQIYWDTKEFISIVDLQLVDYKGKILYETPQVYAEIDGKQTLQVGTGATNYQLTFQITET